MKGNDLFTCNNIGESPENYAKNYVPQNVIKPCDSIYIASSKRQNSRNRE